MNENIKLKGRYRVEARDAKTGKLIKAWAFDNQLTAINQNLRVAMLTGASTPAYTEGMFHIKYFAFGTGTTPASVNDTQLESEQFRKQITQITQPSTGVVQSVVSLTTGEANFNIREIGVFCGADATNTANSGLLLSRVNVDIEKNTNIVLNIVRQDICTI